MYTEIYVSADLKKDTPHGVIEIIQKVCERDIEWMSENGHPSRWGMLFNNGSYYTSNTQVASLTFDNISNNWSVIGKGDIKNYESEIEQFFELIKPWCENRFIGYHMYEEDEEPTLVYAW